MENRRTMWSDAQRTSLVLIFDVAKLISEIVSKYDFSSLHFQGMFQKMHSVNSFPYVPKELEPRVFPYTAAHAPSFMFGQGNQYCAAASQRRPSAAAAGTVSNQNISSPMKYYLQWRSNVLNNFDFKVDLSFKRKKYH